MAARRTHRIWVKPRGHFAWNHYALYASAETRERALLQKIAKGEFKVYSDTAKVMTPWGGDVGVSTPGGGVQRVYYRDGVLSYDS